jgi:hypothetical protein
MAAAMVVMVVMAHLMTAFMMVVIVGSGRDARKQGGEAADGKGEREDEALGIHGSSM